MRLFQEGIDRENQWKEQQSAEGKHSLESQKAQSTGEFITVT